MYLILLMLYAVMSISIAIYFSFKIFNQEPLDSETRNRVHRRDPMMELRSNHVESDIFTNIILRDDQ